MLGGCCYDVVETVANRILPELTHWYHSEINGSILRFASSSMSIGTIVSDHHPLDPLKEKSVFGKRPYVPREKCSAHPLDGRRLRRYNYFYICVCHVSC